MHELSEQRARRLLRAYADGGRRALEAAAGSGVAWPAAFPERGDVERIESRGQAVVVAVRAAEGAAAGWWRWEFAGARLVVVQAIDQETATSADPGNAASPEPPVPRLTLRAQPEDGDGVLRVLVAGELDFGTADLLRGRLGDLIAAGPRIELDLWGVTFIDAAGLHAVVDVTRVAADRGVEILMIRSSRAVVRLAELADEDGLLPPTA